MALTKRELSELVRDLMSGGDPARGAKFHDTIIWKLADTVLGGMIQESMWKNPQTNAYEINGSFLRSFEVDVLEDTVRNEKYSVLPHQVISLKENRGLHRVSELGNNENAFAQVPNGGHDTFNTLESHYLNRKPEFYQEGSRIYYRNIGTAIAKARTTMVPAIAGLDADSPIAIPAEMEDMFIQRIIERLSPQAMTNQDKNNDSNPNLNS